MALRSPSHGARWSSARRRRPYHSDETAIFKVRPQISLLLPPGLLHDRLLHCDVFQLVSGRRAIARCSPQALMATTGKSADNHFKCELTLQRIPSAPLSDQWALYFNCPSKLALDAT